MGKWDNQTMGEAMGKLEASRCKPDFEGRVATMKERKVAIENLMAAIAGCITTDAFIGGDLKELYGVLHFKVLSLEDAIIETIRQQESYKE